MFSHSVSSLSLPSQPTNSRSGNAKYPLPRDIDRARGLTADISRIKRRRALVLLVSSFSYRSCGIRVAGHRHPTNVCRCVNLYSKSRLSTKNSRMRLYIQNLGPQICSYISLASYSVCSMCSISHPISQDGLLGISRQPILSARRKREKGRDGREREEMALPLSCMRYFDPASKRGVF